MIFAAPVLKMLLLKFEKMSGLRFGRIDAAELCFRDELPDGFQRARHLVVRHRAQPCAEQVAGVLEFLEEIMLGSGVFAGDPGQVVHGVELADDGRA